MVGRAFVYGRFGPKSRTMYGLPSPPPPVLPTEAIEILREPSVLEFIGKVYVLTSTRNYQPVTPFGVSNFSWFKEYQDALRENLKFYFKAEQGDLWQVQWFRQESDESGPYIAVGLKHE